MDCKRLGATLAFALTLSGCVWAPGQHLRSSALARDDQPVGNDQIELIQITPKLIAMDRASRDVPALPRALTSYHPGQYQIGVGDILYITVWDHPELTVPAGPQQQLNAAGRLVQSDGTLFYPYIGKIPAAGKTPGELRDEITSKLARVIEAPQVDVSMLTYASQRVWVTGASRQAATVPLTVTPLTLGDAISQSGLDPAQADLSGVRLTREGVTYTIDLDRLGRQGGGATNVFLKANDHLYVPYLDRKEIFVVGEVNQPGAMSFKTSDISLSQALGRARGLQQSTSNGNAVYVIRGSSDLQSAPSSVFQLEAKSPAAFAVASQFELLPGDVVFVGAAGVTRWSRFVNQLLPFTSIISNAASARNDLDN
ncbi:MULTISPECIES: polysaccharide biosynthesis/export family protein [Stenotrophomonas]|uniref:Polysaccharide biosynthesis/export family protein n=1 Tax=Stenotrophomonas bentonitica TaxID=1450134 RepID=A0ABU9JKC4_9GAMM|nr:polysaccharide biosynthesis/export family protein [Stenotrophomonas sp. HMSC10F06]OFS92345.1 capsular biosynthesis protein [Stenotrophomonas sp. HMSC10F06]